MGRKAKPIKDDKALFEVYTNCRHCNAVLENPNQKRKYCDNVCRMKFLPERTKEYRQQNKEVLAVKARQYRQENKDYFRLMSKDWNERNKHKVNKLIALNDLRDKIVRIKLKHEELEQQEALLAAEIEASNNATASSQENTGE